MVFQDIKATVKYMFDVSESLPGVKINAVSFISYNMVIVKLAPRIN